MCCEFFEWFEVGNYVFVDKLGYARTPQKNGTPKEKKKTICAENNIFLNKIQQYSKFPLEKKKKRYPANKSKSIIIQ